MNPLAIRARLGAALWKPPEQIAGGWLHLRKDNQRRILVSTVPPGFYEGMPAMIHASIGGRADMPTYDDLTTMHRAVWGDTGYAYQMFVPVEFHVNFAEHVLHLYGAEDGRPLLPEFSIETKFFGRQV